MLNPDWCVLEYNYTIIRRHIRRTEIVVLWRNNRLHRPMVTSRFCVPFTWRILKGKETGKYTVFYVYYSYLETWHMLRRMMNIIPTHFYDFEVLRVTPICNWVFIIHHQYIFNCYFRYDVCGISETSIHLHAYYLCFK